MAEISTHLQPKPFQVALSNTLDLPYRKWNCIGTVHAVSAESAAYECGWGRGDILKSIVGEQGSVIFQFDNMFIRVNN